jgi:hypothetical protein
MLVEAISKAMAAVKPAPLRKRERARATAAYEEEDEEQRPGDLPGHRSGDGQSVPGRIHRPAPFRRR